MNIWGIPCRGAILDVGCWMLDVGFWLLDVDDVEVWRL